MKRTVVRRLSLLLVVLPPALCAACSSSAPILPLSPAPPAEAPLTLVWVGAAEAERLEEGSWRRIPAFDYDFSVVQRRYGDHWESVKSLHRRHPGYDGSAGPRDQTMYFRADYAPAAADGSVATTLHASLGDGYGQTDREFRRATLELHAEVSSFAPFNTYRIDQEYGYAEGVLKETVSLIKKQTDAETPWVRNRETARLFGPRAFAEAPTTR
jgi:hypothetical protein